MQINPLLHLQSECISTSLHAWRFDAHTNIYNNQKHPVVHAALQLNLVKNIDNTTITLYSGVQIPSGQINILQVPNGAWLNQHHASPKRCLGYIILQRLPVIFCSQFTTIDVSKPTYRYIKRVARMRRVHARVHLERVIRADRMYC